jgi:hypothetical protein
MVTVYCIPSDDYESFVIDATEAGNMTFNFARPGQTSAATITLGGRIDLIDALGINPSEVAGGLTSSFDILLENEWLAFVDNGNWSPPSSPTNIYLKAGGHCYVAVLSTDVLAANTNANAINFTKITT